MAFRYFIVCFLLVACAQIKSLEGGPRDESAPVPMGMVPANETVNFNGQAIAIRFDEYVKLNNPLQTISVIPNDIKIKAELQDKTLLLYWEESMRENTTYSIFLNKTIRDVNESNDSIMQLVFSTGPFIDSLSYSTFVVDAKDGLPKKNMVVGLFDHPDSLRPIYFAQTDQNGKVKLNYLKEGAFYIRAFEDLSKRGIIGKNESIAFREVMVSPGMDYIDSVPLKAFSPLPKPDITTFKFNAPGTFVVGANRSLENAELRLNGNEIPKDRIKFIKNDSLLIVTRPGEDNLFIFSATTDDWTDTTRARVVPTRNKITNINTPSTDYFPGKPIVLSSLDLIDAVDTSKITIFNFTDSTVINDYTFEIKGNELELLIPDFTGEKIKITVNPEALKITEGWTFQKFEQTFNKRADKEFGILNVKISGYSEPIIIEMLSKNAVVKTEFLTESKVLRFEQLEPGEYTFRIILDENGNQQWDTGNFETKTQPEEIHLFSTPTKVRANWEIDVELVPLETTP